jgi:multicomponent Na+:H+ antiporter subunit B
MDSFLLKKATQLLQPLLLLFSVFLLLSGHNEPGGGFVGGLVAAAAFAMASFAEDTGWMRRLVRVDPKALIAAGLGLAVASGLPGLWAGRPYMSAWWGSLQLPAGVRVDVGTPLVFDVGVYLLVLGVVLTILLSFEEG